MRWWEELFSDDERSIYGTYQAKLAERPQLAERRPALIVVDVTRAFCSQPGQTMAEALAEWPTSCGPSAWEAMPYIQRLLAAARAAGRPVIYSKALAGYHEFYGGVVKKKKGAAPVITRPHAIDIPDEIAPRAGELVLQKAKPSAFFGTPLATYLQSQGVDSLLICGTTTSGCVRATVVDGFSHGFPVYLAEEATFDRSRLSHGVSLYEMNAKYVEVVCVDEAVRWLAACAEAA
jgi:nicotinamidase-related amidase